MRGIPKIFKILWRLTKYFLGLTLCLFVFVIIFQIRVKTPDKVFSDYRKESHKRPIPEITTFQVHEIKTLYDEQKIWSDGTNNPIEIKIVRKNGVYFWESNKNQIMLALEGVIMPDDQQYTLFVSLEQDGLVFIRHDTFYSPLACAIQDFGHDHQSAKAIEYRLYEKGHFEWRKAPVYEQKYPPRPRNWCDKGWAVDDYYRRINQVTSIFMKNNE